MTAPDDEQVSGFGAPSAELDRPGGESRSATGAHARRFEVPPIDPPRHPLPDRRRYFLSSFEPSGDYDAVIVAVTDGERRRYFSTVDGARLTEVDEDTFQRRGESGARSLLELDERELGELEAELQFVRPVRGRDPIAEALEAAGVETAAQAEWADAGDEAAEADDEAVDIGDEAVDIGDEAVDAGDEALDTGDEDADGIDDPADAGDEAAEADDDSAEAEDDAFEAGDTAPAPVLAFTGTSETSDAVPDESSEAEDAATDEANEPATDAAADDDAWEEHEAHPLPSADEGDAVRVVDTWAEDEDVDPVTEEFEAMVMESTTVTSERTDAAASVTGIETQGTTSQRLPVAAAPGAPIAATDAIAQVSLAKGIAFVAHRGQLDRSGAPYIDHPGRIAERFDPVTQPIEAAAAWLHDVLEDTPVTAQELFEAGVLPAIIDVVQLLTRTDDVTPDEYYAAIRRDPIARRVKRADIDDNTARWRLRRLEYETQLRLVEKYRHARQALGSD